MANKRVCIIGSRDTPEHVLKVTKAYANILAELGYGISSGGCPLGMDDAAFRGAYKHKTSDKSKNRIYISWDGMSNLWHNPEQGIYDAQRFDNYEVAKVMAQLARGSFEGLRRGGIAHHSRNPYQPMGDTLCDPVLFVLFYAKPDGKNGKVKGGTNTAVKIAIEHGVPVYNLFYQDVLDRVESFVINVKLHQLEKSCSTKPVMTNSSPS